MSSRTVHNRHASDTGLPQARRDVLAIAHELHSRGWVANHDGNVTLRLPAGRWLATPTALSKRVLTEADLIIVDREGRVVQGGRKPFSEFALHLPVYDARADVGAVVHAHPPATTALAVIGTEVDPALIAEAVISLGDRVPLLPYAFPNAVEQVETLAELATRYDVVSLGNHGALAWGDDVEQAYLRLELVEHLAGIQLRAMQAGRPRRLPDADIGRLLDKRTKAGLGPAGRREHGG